KQSGLPCAMAYDLWRALPGVRDLIVTVACRFVTRRLSTSPGVPGPHVFAVRFGRARRTRHHVHRIPPRVRDDREPPLLPRRDARIMLVIWDFQQWLGGAADWHDGQFAHDTHAPISLGLSGKSVIAARVSARGATPLPSGGRLFAQELPHGRRVEL